MKNNHINYQSLMSERIKNAPRSFIREILKTAISPDMISFAGGLPNAGLFPVDEFRKATNIAFEKYGLSLFQYSNSEGFLPLREWISKRYKDKDGWDISPDNILITNGSQQGLDLISKILIDPGDSVIIEEPGYLGAIQSLAVQGAVFETVPLEKDGISHEYFEMLLNRKRSKLFYCVPAFQNPSGMLYSDEKVKRLSQTINQFEMVVVEDNPYREIAFTSEKIPSFYNYIPGQTILLGTFSKTAVPGMRLGWMVAPDELMDRLIVAKQAADLHTDIFSQMVLYQYLINHDIDKHIETICDVYSRQCNEMVHSIHHYFPEEVSFNHPQGGMFLWLNLPDRMSSMELFHEAIKSKVAFVPGVPFYTDGRKDSSNMRLNFSCSDVETIREGVRRLSKTVNKMMLKVY